MGLPDGYGSPVDRAGFKVIHGDALRGRLGGGRLFAQPPEQFQAAAFRRRRSLTAGDSIASEIALKPFLCS